MLKLVVLLPRFNIFQSYDIENYVFKIDELGMSGSAEEDRVAKSGLEYSQEPRNFILSS